MKRSRNYTWLVLGIITIIIGIIIPFVAFNQSSYYQVDKNSHNSSVTFYVTITSKEEIKDIQNAIITLSYDNAEDEDYEVYYVKSSKSDDDFVYEFQFVETQNSIFVDEIKSIKLRTINGVIEIDEKIGLETKIPVAAFMCIIGAFMIFVNFFNNNSKNRTIEIKEIIASSRYNNYDNYDDITENSNEEQSEEIQNTTLDEPKEEHAEPETKIEEVKACEYCGSLCDINDKICASCGAKFKKQD